MNPKNNIAVIGGTGKSGTYLVRELVNKGFHLKLLIRESSVLPNKSPLIHMVTGDVRDEATINALLEDCRAVISTLGMGIPHSEPDIFSRSTTHILRAMKASGIRRYIVTTGLNVDTPWDTKSPTVAAATQWMKTNYPISSADKQKEYEVLAANDLDWTLVRLPLIEQTDYRGDININLKDCPGSQISATNLAHFLIGQLSDKVYHRQAPFIADR